MEIPFRTAYGPHTRVTARIGGKSLTKQSFKEECDINTILKNYRKTGMIEHQAKYQGNYSDLSSAPDYHQAMTQIAEASAAFNSLPSELRNTFGNDPAEFLAFVQDEGNADALVEMGLAKAVPGASAESPPASPEIPAEPAPVPQPLTPLDAG